MKKKVSWKEREIEKEGKNSKWYREETNLKYRYKWGKVGEKALNEERESIYLPNLLHEQNGIQG